MKPDILYICDKNAHVLCLLNVLPMTDRVTIRHTKGTDCIKMGVPADLNIFQENQTVVYGSLRKMRLKPKFDPEIVLMFIIPYIAFLALLKWVGLLG